MYATLRVSAVIALGSLTLAGCSGTDLFGSGSAADVTTSSVAQQTQAQRVDPACASLAAEIDSLRREGVADKIERAAAKKYAMKPADLNKASQLNKANAEFQSKCSTLPRAAAMPDPTAAPAATPPKAAPTKATTKATTTKAAAVTTGAPAVAAAQ